MLNFQACAKAATDPLVELDVSINGEDVPDVMSYRTSSPLFTMSFPEDNLFGVPVGTALSVADTYNIIIAPPPPGEYELRVFGANPYPLSGSFGDRLSARLGGISGF